MAHHSRYRPFVCSPSSSLLSSLPPLTNAHLGSIPWTTPAGGQRHPGPSAAWSRPEPSTDVRRRRTSTLGMNPAVAGSQRTLVNAAQRHSTPPAISQRWPVTLTRQRQPMYIVSQQPPFCRFVILSIASALRPSSGQAARQDTGIRGTYLTEPSNALWRLEWN